MKQAAALLALMLPPASGCVMHWKDAGLPAGPALQESQRARVTRLDSTQLVLDDPSVAGDSIRGRIRGSRQCFQSFDGSRRVCSRPDSTVAIATEEVLKLEVWAADELRSAAVWLIVPAGIASWVILIDACADDPTCE